MKFLTPNTNTMKTIKLFIIGLLFITMSSTYAQVSVNINIGAPPVWGPVGYDKVEYYYLPDIQTYYDIRLSQYIYFGNGKWIRANNLPSRCRNYDLYNGYKVVLTDYHGHSPYQHYNTHKVKYYKGYKGKPQQNRRDYNKHHNNNDNHNNDHHDSHNNDKHDKHEEKGNKGKGKH